MKNTIKQSVEIIKQNAAVPVFYHPSWRVCEQVIRICYQNGFRVFEFTNRGGNAPELFARLKQLASVEMPDMLLGTGTIFTLHDAEKYVDLDTDFIVSPILNPQVGAYCNNLDLLWIPGCMTTTEVYQAHTAGAQIIKLFPGDVLGFSFLKSIRPVFPTLNFMPTGGVTTDVDNLRAWFNAGVMAVGMGSQLLPKKIIESGDWEVLNEHVKKAAITVNQIINQ